MEIIKSDDTSQTFHNKDVGVREYSFKNKKIDLGIATIKGRFPAKGYCVNTKCIDLIYIIQGNGKLYFENEIIDFKEGDSILIDKNEKYYWETSFCKVSESCVPAWNKEQFKIID